MKIIAEIGTAHGTDINKAKELVYQAKNSGADYAKFQIVYADEILHPDSGIVPLPNGNIPLYKNYKSLEVQTDFFYEISEYCKSIDIKFCASPFGFRSLNELNKLNPYFIKIASPELNYYQLLNKLNQIQKKTNVKIVLSSGVSTLSDIEKALNCFEKTSNITLLHCITCYPAPIEEYNISVIENLSKIFGIECGVSDHSVDNLLIPMLTMAFGGTMLEKHITISNLDDGLDDKVALNPQNFKLMCNTLNEFKNASKKEILDYLNKKYDNDLINKAIGNGIKKLAKSEEQNYIRTNRSIHFLKDLKKGQKITEENIAILRTEKILTPGISPEFYDVILNSTLVKNAINGEGLTWSHIINQ